MLAAKVKSGLPPLPPEASHVPLNCNPVGIAAQVPSPFKYVEVVFSLLFGLLFFQELYNFYSLVGVFLIILGLALNLIYKSKEKQTSKK